MQHRLLVGDQYLRITYRHITSQKSEGLDNTVAEASKLLCKSLKVVISLDPTGQVHPQPFYLMMASGLLPKYVF
jgi:hypothetical protein